MTAAQKSLPLHVGPIDDASMKYHANEVRRMVHSWSCSEVQPANDYQMYWRTAAMFEVILGDEWRSQPDWIIYRVGELANIAAALLTDLAEVRNVPRAAALKETLTPCGA